MTIAESYLSNLTQCDIFIGDKYPVNVVRNYRQKAFNHFRMSL